MLENDHGGLSRDSLGGLELDGQLFATGSNVAMHVVAGISGVPAVEEECGEHHRKSELGRC